MEERSIIANKPWYMQPPGFIGRPSVSARSRRVETGYRYLVVCVHPRHLVGHCEYRKLDQRAGRAFLMFLWHRVHPAVACPCSNTSHVLFFFAGTHCYRAVSMLFFLCPATICSTDEWQHRTGDSLSLSTCFLGALGARVRMLHTPRKEWPLPPPDTHSEREMYRLGVISISTQQRYCAIASYPRDSQGTGDSFVHGVPSTYTISIIGGMFFWHGGAIWRGLESGIHQLHLPSSLPC